MYINLWANCDNCKRQGQRVFCKDCLGTKPPSNWVAGENYRPTNSERIRAMSDEELAMWMAEKRVEEIVKVLGLAGVSVKLIESVAPVEEIIDAKAKNIFKWLNQSAEVEE